MLKLTRSIIRLYYVEFEEPSELGETRHSALVSVKIFHHTQTKMSNT